MSNLELGPDESPEVIAAALLTVRDRLVGFVERCDAGQWAARPLAGQGDERPTCVIADHVADAYRYIGEWIPQIVAGGSVEVDSRVVDALNAQHAERAQGVAREEVVQHLRSEGDDFAALVRSLSDQDLALGEGRVGRLAKIGLLHTGGHLQELEDSLGPPG